MNNETITISAITNPEISDSGITGTATPNAISEAQLEANRANAQKSTGPRTEEGKAVARFNARRHGLTGQFYCMSESDEQAYHIFETSLMKDLKPLGAYETQI